MIPAHDSPVAAMAFNSAGTKLSTASEKASLKISKLSCIFFQSSLSSTSPMKTWPIKHVFNSALYEVQYRPQGLHLREVFFNSEKLTNHMYISLYSIKK